ncbi:hypothetical protein M9H77_07024 [Catharanthus roseus]|uniref:Uncharacterized protein n=1 Tax=Catharanthus roseus TaxID=4058 RepID=A0ACC0BTZ0_CATRO|nr:hypothetical protein M9H77_07024 [Catharanthus roseus]
MIKDNLASRGPILLTKVLGNILVKVLEYCKRVVTQPPASENNVDLKAFVSVLVNNYEETLFELLVAANNLDKKGLLSLACEDVLDMINCKDLEHIHKIFPQKRKKRCEGRIHELSTK